MISLEKAKQYLRVDSDFEDDMILSLLNSAYKMIGDILRLDIKEFELLKENDDDSIDLSILYALSYMYENRGTADYNRLLLDLRSLLEPKRKGAF